MTDEEKVGVAADTTLVDQLASEAEELDGYFSDAPLDPVVNYPPLHEGMECAVVITNLPKVPSAKVEKLYKIVLKIVSKLGTLQEQPSSSSVVDAKANETDAGDEEGAAAEASAFSGCLIPVDADGATLGFCFVEYDSPETAQNCVNVLTNYKFDKNHSLNVVPYERAKYLSTIPTETFVEPTPAPFVEKPNATTWLEDANQRDQFVTRYGKETVVHWFDGRPNNDPVVAYDGTQANDAGLAWCDYYCHFSPAGSYFATLVVPRGVILWSGETFQKTGRFAAPGVRHVLFSPQENYLLTNNEDPEDPGAIKVYHIASGTLMRAFPLFPDGVDTNVAAPPFLWSHDDKYLARMGNGLISIFETPSMKLLDRRSMSAEGICEFQWSPQANILAYWAPEQDNSPAHVDLIEIPSRKVLRQKNLFSVSRCSMVWQDQGDYLAVKVTRHTKSKKTMYNNIELFCLCDPGIPVEMLEMKDAVMALQFEPHGSRFAMIHAENPAAAKVKVSFYDMMKLEDGPPPVVGTKVVKKSRNKIAEINLVKTLEGRQCNFISWSPAGSVVIMASLGDSASGTLEFYDVSNKTMVVKEHYRANQVIWDPSGRSVASVVSQPIEGGNFKFAMDNGYILWSFQGKQLYQKSFETFYQLIWRPRRALLSGSEIAKVNRNLKKYEKQFDKADRLRERAMYLEETKGKRDERSKFRDLLARNRAVRQRNRVEYIELLGGYDSDDDKNYRVTDVQVDTVLSTKEEVIVL